MSKTTRKTGFTLVELLVVIAIIGILVGLLIPAIGAVQRRVSEFAINTDVTQLELAIEKFRQDYGFYPPDMSQINSASQFAPFLLQISRSHQEGNGRDGGGLQIWWDEVGQHLDPESAMVFWLSGFSLSAQHPLTVSDGSGGRRAIRAYPVKDTDGNGVDVTRVDGFDFRGDQLEIDGNVARFVQKRGASRSPYIYFNSGSYASVISNNGFVRRADGSDANIMPYFQGTVASPTFPEESDDSFQIIAAGIDGDFGATGEITNIDSADNDNLCSFADGRLEKVL